MTPIRPKFGDPPLFEQAIAVAFESIPHFTLGDFGLFWSSIRSEFDVCEAHPLVEPQIEDFERLASRGFQVQLVPAETLPRCFYRHRDQHELVQLQADRFGFNWLKRGSDAYPHSEATVARFFELYSKFASFCAERGFPAPTVRQCEITNVNIVHDTAVGGVSRVQEFFTQVPGAIGPDILRMEACSYNVQHQILGEHGQPIGRLYQAFSPALRTDTMEQAYRYELTARGAPLAPGNDGIESFFSLARSAINAAFLAGTTRHAHNQWGYVDGDGL